MGAQLGKWAVFSIDNDRRRIGYNSNDNLELLFKKSTSLQFDQDTSFRVASEFCKKINNTAGSGWYFKDVDGKYGEPNKYYIINSLSYSGDNNITSVIQECNNTGNISDDSKIKTFRHTVNSLYDLDQILGGA